LGCLSLVLTQKSIENLIVTVCNQITKATDLNKLYFNVQTISWVASKIGYKLGGQIDSIMNSLLKTC